MLLHISMNLKFLIPLYCFLFVNIYAQPDPFLLKDLKKLNSEVLTVKFSHDGKLLLAGFNDGSARLINIETEENILTLKDHWKGVVSVDMDPQSRFFITAGDNTIKIYTIEGVLVHNLKDQTATIWSAQLDKTGQFIISGAISRIFKLFDALEGKKIADFSDHKDVVMATCFSPDGKLIASASTGNIKIRNIDTREILMTLPSHAEDIYALTFSNDGKLLASGSKDKTIRLYDMERKMQITEYKGHKDIIMDLAFSPDGNYLLSCSFDQTIRLWEIPTGRTIYTFIDHKLQVTGLDFCKDGKSFASSSMDKTIKIWNFSPEIFVDFYFKEEVTNELKNYSELFQPRQKGELKPDYDIRIVKANEIRKEIYSKYYAIYRERLMNSTLEVIN